MKSRVEKLHFLLNGYHFAGEQRQRPARVNAKSTGHELSFLKCHLPSQKSLHVALHFSLCVSLGKTCYFPSSVSSENAFTQACSWWHCSESFPNTNWKLKIILTTPQSIIAMFHHLRHSLSLTTYTYVNGEIVYNCLLVPFLSLLILLSYFWMANTLWFQIVILFSAYCTKLHGSLDFLVRYSSKNVLSEGKSRIHWFPQDIKKKKCDFSLGFGNLLKINIRHVV